jgi:hypothetical protein
VLCTHLVGATTGSISRVVDFGVVFVENRSFLAMISSHPRVNLGKVSEGRTIAPREVPVKGKIFAYALFYANAYAGGKIRR